MMFDIFTIVSAILTLFPVVSAEVYPGNVLKRTQEASRPSCSNFTSFAYAGCFSDLSSPRSLLFSGPSNKNMTVETCVAFCKGNDYKYAGLEYYKECFCGATVNGPQVNESSCSFPCAGDKTETCGGNDFINVYQDTTFPVTDITTISDYMPMGCYSEGSMGRSLAWKQNQLNASAMSVELCLSACKGGGYAFGGLEFGKECYCGVVLGNGTLPLDSTSCNMPCTGNAAEKCGGRSALNLYVATDLESTQPCNGGGGVLSSSSSVVTSTTASLRSSSSQIASTTGTSTSSTISSSSAQSSSSSSSSIQTTSSSSTISSTLSSVSSITSSSSDEPVFTPSSSSTAATTSSSQLPSTSSLSSSSSSTTVATSSSQPPTTSSSIVSTSTSPSSSSLTSSSQSSSSVPQPTTSSCSSSSFSSSSSSQISSSSSTMPYTSSTSTTLTSSTTSKPPPASSPPVTSSTKTSASLCTSTIVTSATPTCEYKCGKWCSKPIPAFSDSTSCFTAFSSCMVQLSGCFLQAGFPDSLNCLEFSNWCTSISSYCTNSCPGPNCHVGGCKSKYPPPPGPATPPPTTSISVYTCPMTTVTSTKLATSTIKPSSTTCVPVPTNSNICKQPSNPWGGYDIDNPVGGIPLPCLTCNNLLNEFKGGNCFKLYVDPDTSNCPSYSRSGNRGPAQGCRDACDNQYNSCMDTYAEGCRQKKRRGSDSYGSASQKCTNQWNDCYAVNSGVSVNSGRCGSYNAGWW